MINEFEKEHAYIETYTGKKFEFLDPKDEMFDIFDIGKSLSKQCRYMGHVKKFYSVAEHCCLLYDAAGLLEGVKSLDIKDKRKMLRTVLLHDASEAYLVDMARPIKNYFPEYREREEKISIPLAKVFDIYYPYPPLVKQLDNRILVDERIQAMNKSDNVWASDSLEPLNVIINFWDPEYAYTEFLKRYFESRWP